MKSNIYISLLALFSVIFCGCKDEVLHPGNNFGQGFDDDTFYDGTGYDFSLMVNDGLVRSRDVNFEQGASLRINSLWLGIFDLQNGECVSNNSILMDFAPVTSGRLKNSFVREKLEEPHYSEANQGIDPADREYIMVCVANFQDVYIHDKATNTFNQTLQNKLENLSSWEEFDQIGVETISAYQYPHNSDAPILAGFLNNNNYLEKQSAETHVKIDQFAEKSNQGHFVTLSPAAMMDDLIFKFKPKDEAAEGSEGFYYVTDGDNNDIIINKGKTIFLRRLVANVNVNVSIDNPDLILTDLSYRRVHMPRAVYIIERKTTECDTQEKEDEEGVLEAINSKGFPKSGELSANYADLDPENLYYSDQDWIRAQSNNYFSFQQFANKHWARTTPGADIEREELLPNTTFGTDANGFPDYKFKALSDLTLGKDDFNNYASYFIIKIHLIDKATGRALEAEYMIHLGNTSDELGNSTGWVEKNGELTPAGNPYDYVIARNMNYYYDVHVAGVNNIYHNVTVDRDHFSGQGGKVWRMVYVNDPKENGSPVEGTTDKCYYDSETGDFINPVPAEGGEYDYGIMLKAGKVPDIAFRLYGYNMDTGKIEGYNYNFPQESFTWLNTLWPPSAAQYSHYFLDYKALVNNKNSKDAIPDNLLNGLKIEDMKTHEVFDNIIGFIQSLNGVTLTEDKNYKIIIGSSELPPGVPIILDEDKNNYVRAIFIADRNGEPDPIDGCTRLVNIYSAAQYPEYVKGDFQMIMSYYDQIDWDKFYGGTRYEGKVPYYGDGYDINNNLRGNDNYPKVTDNGMIFTETPDLAFRIFGYVDPEESDGEYTEGKYYDICYNFSPEDYPKYTDYWPRRRAETIVIDKNSLNTIPNELLNGLKVHISGGPKTMAEIVNEHEAEVYNTIDGFTLDTYGYKVFEHPENSCRGLYVFDKNVFKNNYLLSEDRKEVKYQIYGIEQLPMLDSRKQIFFDIKDMIGHDKIYKKSYSYWDGTKSGVPYVSWYHKEGIIGYVLDMSTPTAGGKVDNNFHFEIGETELSNYLHKLDDKDIFVFPWPNLGWSANYQYDLKITPIVNTNMYFDVMPFTVENMLRITSGSGNYHGVWDFNTSPWNGLADSDFPTGSGGIDDFTKIPLKTIQYNGLEIYSNGDAKPTFQTNNGLKNLKTTGNRTYEDGFDMNTLNFFFRLKTVRNGKIYIKYGSNGGASEVNKWISVGYFNQNNKFVELGRTTPGSKENPIPGNTTPRTETIHITPYANSSIANGGSPIDIYLIPFGGNFQIFSIQFEKD